jgi:hypothetical protein
MTAPADLGADDRRRPGRFITIFASSTTASINASIDRSFAGDFVINSGAGTTGGFDPALAPKLNALLQVPRPRARAPAPR